MGVSLIPRPFLLLLFGPGNEAGWEPENRASVIVHSRFSSIPSQGHDCPVRSMEWSHNGTWMVTTDDRGFVKYWQSNMNNVHTFQAHSEPVRSSRWDRVVCKSTFVRFSINSMLVLTLMLDLLGVNCNGISSHSLDLPNMLVLTLMLDLLGVDCNGISSHSLDLPNDYLTWLVLG